MTLASSAPPETETISAIVDSSIGSPRIREFQVQTKAAASSWRQATMLVARCVAPSWVR